MATIYYDGPEKMPLVSLTEYTALQAELARLQAALLTCAAIPHMGQYTGSRVRAAIEESKPWTVTPKS